jgi:drug/metabolite transporter (DMT)-like permease
MIRFPSTGSFRENEQLKGFLSAVITAVLWSSSGLVIKLVDWHPIAISGSRSLVAALLLIAVHKRFRLPRSLAGWGAAIAYALSVTLFVIANKLTTSANAIFLQYLAPAFVAMLSIFLLKEALRLFDWLILAGVLGGMVLFFIDRMGPGEIAGNIVAVSSGFTFALFIVCMRINSVKRSGKPIDNIIVSHLLAVVISIPFVFTSPVPDGRSVLGILFLGLVQIGLSGLFFTYAVARITAFSVSIISLIEPVMNPVWVYLIIGELPSPMAAAGGLVIIALVTLRSTLVLRRARIDS